MNRRNKKSSAGADTLGEPMEFLRAIWALDHQLQTASRRMEQVLGVTGPQRFVLRVVSFRPGVTPGEVARIMHVHPSTLTGVLQRLERRRLLVRKADQDDARRVHLQLTESGRTVAGQVSGTIEDAIKSILGRAPRARVDAAKVLLTELTAALEALKPVNGRAR